MKLRSASLLDLPQIEQIYKESGTPPPTQLPPARLWSIVSQTLTAFLPLSSESLLYVAENEGRIVGFIQASGRAPQLTLSVRVTALQLLNLCVKQDVDLEEVAPMLLEHLITKAGQRGVKRLFVRLPLEDQLLPIFQALGFRWVATEEVLWATLPTRLEAAMDDEEADWRPKRRGDERRIYRLYNRVTPPEVVGLEAPTYRQWRELQIFSGQQEVLGEEQLVAWLCFHQGSGARPHTISLLARSDDPGVAQRVVDRAVRRCEGGAAWASLRHYDKQALAAMRQRGFSTLLIQGLLVRDVAVQSPASESGLVPSFS